MIRPIGLLLALSCVFGCGDDDATVDTDPPAGDSGTERDATPPGEDGFVPPLNRSEPAAYIRGAHPRLVIELDVEEGLEPSAGVEALFIDALTPLLDKPEGITIIRDDVLPASGARDEWTFEQLIELADATFDAVGDEGDAVFHTLWLSGSYVSESGGTVLGVAWANRYIAMFAETIASACSSALPLVRERICREAEAAVWTHEAGHVIGLVNNPLPMAAPHEDAEHPAHTSNSDGVMYWAYERASIVDLLITEMASGGDRLFEFGPESLADVAAFREGG